MPRLGCAGQPREPFLGVLRRACDFVVQHRAGGIVMKIVELADASCDHAGRGVSRPRTKSDPSATPCSRASLDGRPRSLPRHSRRSVFAAPSFVRSDAQAARWPIASSTLNISFCRRSMTTAYLGTTSGWQMDHRWPPMRGVALACLFGLARTTRAEGTKRSRQLGRGRRKPRGAQALASALGGQRSGVRLVQRVR